jgi:hypothetical protein
MGVVWKPSFETCRAIMVTISVSVSMDRTIARAREGGNANPQFWSIGQ